jgi:hypothetical protein
VDFASGKDPGFQPARRAMQSPGVSGGGIDLLQRRSRALPVIDDKRVCHSDIVADPAQAQAIQTELTGAD